ncbi:NAD(+) synthase [Bacteroidetes bacterium endosymbiont of Geopemphigus sp.]|uniref:NAD(+) synthase n=1 Tax=Bacteroidetes bacterium endosymbiont of Geopemphigus sp. TaxID=2047937 RepID=UPI000CD04DE2|nr:NAD(+) synthase [Bacteroidetes bacterium endosymbiont of Geopemphigus sp.]
MRTRKIIEHIVSWLNAYIEKTPLKGFVIGVSGGIDSAVTSVLVAKTRRPVLVLEMPIHQENSQVKRAQEHICFLKKHFPNVQSKMVDLSPLLESFCSVVKTKKETSYQLGLTLANTRSRLRMSTLYYYAGLYKYLVSGTGNKIEDFGVGFFTKYGDGGVDISPIADLTKTQVRALASELNIITSIQEALTTDGLWEDNRSDEEQLGASYEELEWAMEMAQQGKNKERFSEREKELIEKYQELHASVRHKIEPVPVCKIPVEFF